jgi:glycosyltransferase involved in cell wall biosynthesis
VLPYGLWGRRKEEALVDADAFCLPSATENFGIAAAEAAVAGLPVVVSDRCGVAEWLDPGAARVVPFGQVETLSAALEDVVWKPGIRATARAAAPRMARALDWVTLARRQEQIYHAAVEAHGPRESPVGPLRCEPAVPPGSSGFPHPRTLKRLERGAD